MCTVAESKNIYIYILFGWLIKIIHLPFFFFFILSRLSLSFSLISQAHSLNSGLTLSTPVTDPRSSTQAQSLNSDLTLSTPTLTHEARRQSKCLTGKPMELAANWSACLWILVISHCQWLYHAADRRFRLFFFLFLLWTVDGGGVVDGGCGYGCEEEDWRFGFLFFIFCFVVDWWWWWWC